MKILYICTFYHRALLFRQQMDALIDRGYYVRAFSSAQYNEGIADKFIPIMDDKVKHFECWNKLDRMLFFPRQWKIEKKINESYDVKSFDLLHAHLLLSTGYSALRLKKKYGIPYVVSVRVTDLNGFIKFPYFKRMAVSIIEEANGVLFLSKSHKQEFEKKFLSPDEREILNQKVVIIGNCLENFWSEHISEARSCIPDKEIKILSVAKISPVKNLPVAAESVEELNRRGYKATLTIVGENQNNEEFEKLKKYNCVNIMPFMAKEELIREYANNDIFLLPSVNETFGRVYIEAMTQGLPVLYTAGQGFDKTFDEGVVGYSIPSDNPSVIADKVETVITNYFELSSNCIKNSTVFSEKRIMDELEQFYVSALNR